jgi:Heterokaryon incompatibility protein (HET)
MTSSSVGATESLSSIYDPYNEVYHDLHPREIRLVELFRGRWSDTIRCQLHRAASANRPAYKALSYAWGSPRATRPVLVNGYQHLVTVNLESALRRLRRVDSDLTLWIDALCINQSFHSPGRRISQNTGIRQTELF